MSPFLTTLTLAFGLPCATLLAQAPAVKPPAATPAPAPSVAPAPTVLPATAPAAVEAPATPAEATPTATPAPSVAPGQPIARPVPLSPGEVVDSLSDADIRQALEVIRSHYVDGAAMTDDALRRATLQGVLDRLGSSVGITTPATTPVVENEPFRAEILDDRIGYIRLGTLNKDRLAEFDAMLASFKEKKISAIVLDLRSTPLSSDFEAAAELVKRITPKGKMLFAVRRPKAKQEQIFTSSVDPIFHGVVVTVVNRNTAGAGEVIAGVLRSVTNALVVGEKTAGEAAEYAVEDLRGGKRLRVAVGEVNLPGDLNIFPGGLTPDVVVEVPPARELEILRAGLEHGVSGLVFETERARRNEAALVAGTNPELDEELETLKRGTPRRTLSDPALQRAVDLVTSIQIFHRQNP